MADAVVFVRIQMFTLVSVIAPNIGAWVKVAAFAVGVVSGPNAQTIPMMKCSKTLEASIVMPVFSISRDGNFYGLCQS